MKKSKISVCIATYNGEKYISEQLTSILNQLGPNDEVIVSDDGSEDNTIELIELINDPRIRIIHSFFKNVILNFENAIKRATGDLIFLADQDDIWYDNKIDELTGYLKDYELVFSNVNVFHDDIQKSYPLYNSDKNYNGFAFNLIKNHCIGATMAFKSDILKYVLPFPKNIPMHDMWIFFITSYYGKTYYYKKPLVYYRRHGLNVTNTGGKSTNNIFKMIKIRLQIIGSVLRRVILVFINKLN